MASNSGIDTGTVAAITAAVAAVLSAVVTHTFGRPKQKADVHSAIATGASTAVEAITEVLEQVRQELEDARAELHQLREENAVLRESVALLNIRISQWGAEHGTNDPGSQPV